MANNNKDAKAIKDSSKPSKAYPSKKRQLVMLKLLLPVL
jgi:hypothetical protein